MVAEIIDGPLEPAAACFNASSTACIPARAPRCGMPTTRATSNPNPAAAKAAGRPSDTTRGAATPRAISAPSWSTLARTAGVARSGWRSSSSAVMTTLRLEGCAPSNAPAAALAVQREPMRVSQAAVMPIVTTTTSTAAVAAVSPALVRTIHATAPSGSASALARRIAEIHNRRLIADSASARPAV